MIECLFNGSISWWVRYGEGFVVPIFKVLPVTQYGCQTLLLKRLFGSLYNARFERQRPIIATSLIHILDTYHSFLRIFGSWTATILEFSLDTFPLTDFGDHQGLVLLIHEPNL